MSRKNGVLCGGYEIRISLSVCFESENKINKKIVSNMKISFAPVKRSKNKLYNASCEISPI